LTSLADTVGIDQIGADQFARVYGAGIADCQRRVEQWPSNRPPEIDDLHPALEQFFGLARNEIADPLRT
jgi:hypothetical protein